MSDPSCPVSKEKLADSEVTFQKSNSKINLITKFLANLSAKRVDFSARTVISPDPNLAIDEVVMPIHMAKELTWPEEVNNLNFAFLKTCILNGSENYPGANYLVKQTGQKFTLAYGNKR
jgi:DNA-directed RNA polymerase III subunit RPC1